MGECRHDGRASARKARGSQDTVRGVISRHVNGELGVQWKKAIKNQIQIFLRIKIRT